MKVRKNDQDIEYVAKPQFQKSPIRYDPFLVPLTPAMAPQFNGLNRVHPPKLQILPLALLDQPHYIRRSVGLLGREAHHHFPHQKAHR